MSKGIFCRQSKKSSGGESRESGRPRAYSWHCHLLMAAPSARAWAPCSSCHPPVPGCTTTAKHSPRALPHFCKEQPFNRKLLPLILTWSCPNFFFNGKGSPTITMFTDFIQCFQCSRVNLNWVILALFALSHGVLVFLSPKTFLPHGIFWISVLL